MPSARGLAKLAGATFAGFAVAAMVASPAMACDAAISGKPVCDTKTGTVTVTWTLSNDDRDATFTATGKPGTLSKTQGAIPGHGTVEIVQTGVPANTAATITIDVVWPDAGPRKPRTTQHKESQPKQAPCVQDSPSPRPSPSRSHGGGAGGGPAPTPSSTVPSLPVTGSNVPIYAGSALGLVGVGGVLFFVARRRRIRFEA